MAFKDKIARFMYGRYGYDTLSLVLFAAAFIVSIANVFTPGVWRVVLYLLSLALFAAVLCRVFSRNVSKRRAENNAFLKIWKSITSFFLRSFNRVRYIGKYRYRKCPHCKKHLRLPRAKGSHSVSCPCCKNSFDVNIRF